MKYCRSKILDLYVLAFQKGEDILETFQKHCEKENIRGGAILQGIGAFKRCRLGYFDIERKKYIVNDISEPVELVHCSGTISLAKESIMPHIHATVAKQDGSCVGGHIMFGSIISITAEIVVVKIEAMQRKIDTETGLMLLDPE